MPIQSSHSLPGCLHRSWLVWMNWMKGIWIFANRLRLSSEASEFACVMWVEFPTSFFQAMNCTKRNSLKKPWRCTTRCGMSRWCSTFGTFFSSWHCQTDLRLSRHRQWDGCRRLQAIAVVPNDITYHNNKTLSWQNFVAYCSWMRKNPHLIARSSSSR